MTDAAFDNIGELENAQSGLEDKLKGFGSLYSSGTVKFAGEEIEIVSLADVEKQTQALEDYAQALLDVKARGDVPQEFFSKLRDLSVEEGTKFAKALLMADDKTFNKYVDDLQLKWDASDKISKLLYADEAKEVQKEIKQSFEDFGAGLDEKGKQNAEAWGEGFLQEVRKQLPSILAEINSALGSLISAPQLSISGAGGGSVINNYNSATTYHLASSNEPVHRQLQTIAAAETVNRLRGK